MLDPRDPGTLGYIIVHRRPDQGLPLLSKALPSVSEMDDHRRKWPDSDVALYLTEEGARAAWSTLDEGVRARTDVRAVVTYYVQASEDISLELRHRLIKKEVSRMVYTRNKLSSAIEETEKELREIEDQLPHTEADAKGGSVLAVLREKKEKGESRLLELRRDFGEASLLSERAKEGLLALQGMMAEGQKSQDSLALRASAREAMRHLDELLGPVP